MTGWECAKRSCLAARIGCDRWRLFFRESLLICRRSWRRDIYGFEVLCGHTACAYVPGEAEQRPSLRRFPNNLSSVTKPFAAMVTDARWVDSIMVRAPHGRSLSGPGLFLSGRTDPFLMSYSCQLLQSGICRLRFHCAVSANNHWMVRLFKNRAVTVLL